MQQVGKLSSYANSLPATARKRYAEKIRILNFIDPYDVKLGSKDFPTNVTTGHVVDYLLKHISASSGNHIKNVKSVEAYKKFEAGFIHNVVGGQINGFFVVRGKVAHSMKLNQPALNAWVIVRKDGTVASGHCTCVAGLSETCSHVSALLYALANLHSMASTQKLSVTDLPSYWARPSKKVKDDLYHPVQDTDYGYKIVRMDDMDIPASQDTFMDFMADLKDTGSDAAILRKFCDGHNFSCRECQQNDEIPNEIFQSKSILLQNLFAPELEGETIEKIRDISESVMITVSSNEIELIEKLTRRQAKCDLWRWVRVGRITGSILKECTRASTTTVPSKMSLLQKMCYPEPTICTEAMAYGKKYEDRAKKAFEKTVKQHHKNAQFEECGVFIDRVQPYMSSSPDMLMMCDCCGKSSVEVKCPFRLSGKTNLNNQLKMVDLTKNNHPFLEIQNDEYFMVKSHEYYAQVQAEIFITASSFGWFFVWSKDEELCLRIEKDMDFWEQACENSAKYFKNIVLPELLAHYFSNTNKTS